MSLRSSFGFQDLATAPAESSNNNLSREKDIMLKQGFGRVCIGVCSVYSFLALS